MIRRTFQHRETIATLLADSEEEIQAGIRGMLEARREVERCIARDPFFALTYSPYPGSCEGITTERMVRASSRAGVGPMAAVAGAIAWAGIEAMVAGGARFAVIDNGGDIALVNDRPVRVGVYAGDAPLSNQKAFLVPPQERILGICTSSATVGHSVSLGVADAVTVCSYDVAAADAWATALCNTVTVEEPDPHPSDPILMGVLVVIGATVRTWGVLPPLVPSRGSEDRITRGDPLLTAPFQYTGAQPGKPFSP